MDRHPRQPTDEVFKDIVEAGVRTWYARCNWDDYHQDYVEEKTNRIYSLTNYADNWYSVLGAMDEKNQMIFWHCLELKDSEQFLKDMKIHYSYFVPKEKK